MRDKEVSPLHPRTHGEYCLEFDVLLKHDTHDIYKPIPSLGELFLEHLWR